jgi:hypothetical protein
MSVDLGVDVDVDLVNAALLGTDRRPVAAPAGTDPAVRVLEGAASRRALGLVAAASGTVRPGPSAPPPATPEPSVAARAILDELLLTTATGLLDLWLGEALAAGTGLAREHWTPVLDRARRATDLDRRRLAAGLGPDGLWFARQNPAWAGVVRAMDTLLAAPAPVAPDATTVAREPARLLDLSPPWPDAAVRVAADALEADELPTRSARVLGQRLGAGAPLEAYDRVVDAGLAAQAPAVRAGFAAAEEVLRLRWELAHAFDPVRVPPPRRSVPLAAAHPLEERR